MDNWSVIWYHDFNAIIPEMIIPRSVVYLCKVSSSLEMATSDWLMSTTFVFMFSYRASILFSDSSSIFLFSSLAVSWIRALQAFTFCFSSTTYKLYPCNKVHHQRKDLLLSNHLHDLLLNSLEENLQATLVGFEIILWCCHCRVPRLTVLKILTEIISNVKKQKN